MVNKDLKEWIFIETDGFRQTYMRGPDRLKHFISSREESEGNLWSKYGKKDLLGGKFLFEIYSQRDIRNLVILSQLYLEYICDKIIKKRFRYPEKIFNSNLSFYQKLNVLRAEGYLSEDVYNDLDLINRLRNKYAHELFYDITNFDFSKFSFFEDLYGMVNPKEKDIKIMMYRYVLKLVLHLIIERLGHKFPFIENLKSERKD